MKNIVFFRLALLFFSAVFVSRYASAQDVHYAYIQTEDKQPFYALFQNRNIQSSSIGYIILGKLEDGSYPLRIGFKGNPNLQDFVLNVNASDLGLVIKDLGEKGWGLFNMQTAELQVSGEETGKIQAALAVQKAEEEKRITDSLYAVQEAQRLSDSLQAEALITQQLIEKAAQQKRITDSLNDKIAAKQTRWKEDSVKASLRMQRAAEKAAEQAKQKETVAVNKTTDKNSPAKAEAAIAVTVAAGQTTSKTAKNSAVKSKSTPPVKLSQFFSDEGLVILYKDGADTVNAFIPTENVVVKTSPQTIEKRQANDTVVKVSTTGKKLPAESKKAVAVVAKKRTTVNPKAAPKLPVMDINSDSANAKQPVVKQDTLAIAVKPVEIKEPETKTFITVVETTDNASKKKKTSGITSNNSNTKIVTVTPPPPVVADSATAATVALNAACKEQATDKDFYSLRKKMAANDNPDAMISAAKKAFKEKCYSTTQVRNLCVLFLSDPERYMFLDAAYAYTSDDLNFSKLSDLLQDDYYVRRFKAMLK